MNLLFNLAYWIICQVKSRVRCIIRIIRRLFRRIKSDEKAMNYFINQKKVKIDVRLVQNHNEAT